MAQGTNGAGSNGKAGPAYPITDHTFDVIVVGAGGAGLRATVGCARAGLRTACINQSLPHALAYGGGAGRHLGGARQYGAGRLALAHV